MLNFLNPWVAAGLAAVVLPALIILYFLKLRRREEKVPSTFLWKRAVQDLQVNAPFQRLRRNLLLFLQLAVLILALLALARPIVRTDLADEKSVVMLIDRSASMKTREGDKTRFEQAREQAARFARTLNRTSDSWLSFIGLGGASANTRVMVIAFADRPTVICPFTTNASDAAGLIEAIEPSEARTNLAEAIKLAQAYMMPGRGNVETGSSAGVPLVQNPVNPETPSKLMLFSDGAVDDVDDVTLLGNIELIPTAQVLDNVGITAFRMQRNYEKPEMLDVFAQIQNFGPEPVTTDVTLYVDGQFSQGRVETVSLAAARMTDTQPAEQDASGARKLPTASLSFQFPLEKGALLEARLSRDDPLMVDNRAYATVPPPRKMNVLLVSKENKFIEFVLNGLPLAGWKFMSPEQYEAAPAADVEAEGQSKYDVVIFDKYSPTRFPTGNYLFFGAAPPVEGVKGGDQVSDFAMMWWDETHPLLRHVNLDYVLVGKAVKLELPRGIQTLAEGPHGPVMCRFVHEGRNCVVVSFSPELSTWWSKPSFPVFTYNAMRFLNSDDLLSGGETVRPGDALRFQLPAGASKAVVHRPDSSKLEVLPDSSQIARFAGTRDVGIYRVDPGIEGRDRYAVNLLDASESNIQPRAFKVGGQSVKIGEKIRLQTPEIWRWFVGAALAMVLFEWYIYNRRVMI